MYWDSPWYLQFPLLMVVGIRGLFGGRRNEHSSEGQRFLSQARSPSGRSQDR